MANNVEFISVEIEGFGSIIGPFLYNLRRKGVNLILGENGTGKTTIFSAITWAAYGKTLKKKNNPEPWEKVKPKKFKGTRVVLKFKAGKDKYELISCHKYKEQIHGALGKNRLILIQNGRLMDELRDKEDIRRFVKELWNCSFELFKTSILFGQKLKRVIQEDGSKKKEIFEEAFETTYITKVKDIAQTKEKELQLEYNTYDDKIENLEKLLEGNRTVRAQVEAFEERKRKEVKDLNKRIKREEQAAKGFKDIVNSLFNNAHEVSLCEDEIHAHEDMLINYEKVKDRDFKLSLDYTELKSKIEQIGKDQKKLFKSREAFTCKYCGTVFKDKEQSLEHRKSEMTRLKKEGVKWAEQLVGLLEKWDRVKEKLKSLNTYKYELSQANRKLQILQLNQIKRNNASERLIECNARALELTKKKTKVKKAKNDINLADVDEVIAQHTLSIKKLKKASKKIKTQLDLYKWAIKEPLSNSGIKAYIFNQMLGKVNQKLKQYEEFTGFGVKFGVDLESARKDFYIAIEKAGEVVDYEELSGGQQQMVDVCIAFAIHEVRSEDVHCNILVLDEIFENLSESKVEIVSEMIQRKAIDKSIHLITHQKDLLIPNAHKIMLVVDEHGRTKETTI